MNKYLTLSVDPTYPGNEYSRFYHVLEEPLSISGAHEVALTEIMYSCEHAVKIGHLKIYIPDYIKHNMEYNEENSLEIETKALDETNEIVKLKFTHINELKKEINTLLEVGPRPETEQDLDSIKKYDENLIRIQDNIDHYQFNILKNQTDIKKYIRAYSTSYLSSKPLLSYLEFEDLLDLYTKLRNFRRLSTYMIQFTKEIKSNIKFIKKLNNSQLYEEIYDIYAYDHDLLNKSIKKIFQIIHKHSFIGKDRISFKPYVKQIIMSDSLKRYFNVTKAHVKVLNSPQLFEVLDMTLKVNKVNQTRFLKVYCDIIEDNSYFGKQEKIIKIVKCENKYDKYNEKTYNNPQYVGLNKTFITKININIIDQDNNFIQSSYPPILVLNIRKKKK